MKTIVKKILLIFVIAILVSTPIFAESTANPWDVFVSRADFNEWKKNLQLAVNNLEQTVVNYVENSVRFNMWERNVTDNKEPVLTEQQLSQFRKRKAAIDERKVKDIYNVKFDLCGGEWGHYISVIPPVIASSSQPIIYRHKDDEVVLPTGDDVYCFGRAFIGWWDNANFDGEQVVSIPAGTAKNTIFYAKWGESDTYPILYYLNDGNFIGDISTIPQEGNYNETRTLPDGSGIVEKEGFVFGGWYDNEECKGSPITMVPTGIRGFYSVYAHWEAISYPINYEINGGSWRDISKVPFSKKYNERKELPTYRDVFKEGYTFDGWYENETLDGNVVRYVPSNCMEKKYYAKWEENTYAVRYYINNGHFVDENEKVKMRKYTEGVTLLDASRVYREGYGFGGWYNNAGVQMVEVATNSALNYDIYAKWNEESYTITLLNLEDVSFVGGYTPPTSRVYSKSVTLPTSTNMLKDGYIFGGWYETSDFSGSIVTVIPKNIVGHKTYYAKWDEVTYKIEYDIQGGSFVSGRESIVYRRYSEGMTLYSSDDVYRIGWTFGGWYDNDRCVGTPVTSVPAFIDEDKKFYAKWSENSYSITYHNDGSWEFKFGYVPQTIRDYTDSVTLPKAENMVKAGNRFVGWYENADFSGNVVTTVPANTADNKDLYPKWEELTYTITYHLNGGKVDGVSSVGDTIKVERKYSVGVTLYASTLLSKQWNTFDGWYDNARCEGSSVTSVAPNTAENKDFYAKWNEDEYSITLLNLEGVTFVSGYTPPTRRYYSKSTTLPTAGNMSKTGYEFAGWYENAGFSGSAVTIIAAYSGDKTYYAKWNEITYKVEYDIKGGSFVSGRSNVTYRKYTESMTLYIAPDDVYRTGYTFNGWYENESYTGSPVTTVAANTNANKKYYAKWTEIVYNMEYVLNGGSSSVTLPATRKYSQKVDLPHFANMTSPASYKFRGWYSEAPTSGVYNESKRIASVAANTTVNKVYARFDPYINWSGVGSTDWMAKIPDDMYLNEINIPGTHDSVCKEVVCSGSLGVESEAETQDKYLEDQLSSGCRVFDIRVFGHDNHEGDGDGKCGHGEVVSQDILWWTTYIDQRYFARKKNGGDLYINDVFNIFQNYLSSHKNETIIMFIKKEDGDESSYVNKVTEAINNHKNVIWNNTSAKNYIPTMGEARGKIVVCSRSAIGSNVTLRFSWQNNSVWNTTTNGVSFKIEDRYDNGADGKLNCIKEYINACATKINTEIGTKMTTGGILFTSASNVPITPRMIAGSGITNYIKGSPTPFEKGVQYGWVKMDFVEEGEAKAVYQSNP